MLITCCLVPGRQHTEVFGAAQDTHAHIDPVHPAQQARLKHFCRSGIGYDAMLEQHQAWEVASRQVEVMHGGNNSDAKLAIQPLYQLEDTDLVFNVEMRGGLI